MNPADENEYYTNWIYSALHILGTLQIDLNVDLMAQRLGKPEAVIRSALEFLKKNKLVEINSKGIIMATKKNIHLSNQNWMATIQHKNWRIAALERNQNKGLQEVRYSGIHSLSHQDLNRLREKIKDFLITVDDVVRPSKEETVCFLCLDLFEI